MAAVKKSLPGRVFTSASPFSISTAIASGFNSQLRCIDLTDSRLIAHDTTNAHLKQSTDWGSTWSAHKGWPSSGTGTNTYAIVRFGDYLYALFIESGTLDIKVARTLPKSGDTAYSWSNVYTVNQAGALGIPTGFTTDGTYLYVAEYGDPTGGPAIHRTSDGTTWTVVRAADSGLRHFHAIEADPYNAGHLWVTAGDGSADKVLLKSTDYGSTWSTVLSDLAWQGVQISFSRSWVFIAGDQQRGTVMVVDRATGTPRMAAQNWHYNLVGPGFASTDTFYRNAYYGIVDPSTGIYYSASQDTSVSGNKVGLFYLPRVGGNIELIEVLSIAPQRFRIANGYLWFGNYKRPLYTMEDA